MGADAPRSIPGLFCRQPRSLSLPDSQTAQPCLSIVLGPESHHSHKGYSLVRCMTVVICAASARQPGRGFSRVSTSIQSDLPFVAPGQRVLHTAQLQLLVASEQARHPAKTEAKTGAAVDQHMQPPGLLPQLWPLLEHAHLHHIKSTMTWPEQHSFCTISRAWT